MPDLSIKQFLIRRGFNPTKGIRQITPNEPMISVRNLIKMLNSMMQPGEILNPNQSINSANGRYTFVYQGDGNLVLYKNYRNYVSRSLWSSGTDGKLAGVCIMQGDGNLVIIDADGRPIWDSETWNNPGSHLVAQDDGNVVIYRPNNTPVWSTDTMQPPPPPTGPTAHGNSMQPGEILNPDQSINSANGRYTFVYQGDGNLVLYKNYRNYVSRSLWSSGTDGKLAGVCIMQGDGNLVIIDADGRPIWDSETWNNPGNHLVAQDDGNVVIYRPDNTPIWSTNTMQRPVPTGPIAHGNSMQPSEVLNPNQSINSANGRYTLVYQGSDGNLVLYENYKNSGQRSSRWASNTTDKPAGVCIMQGSDGNLVLIDADGNPYWSSETANESNFGSWLVVQDDGHVRICRPDNTLIWEQPQIVATIEIRPLTSVLNYPQDGQVNESAILWATVKDRFYVPIEGVNVDWSVSGDSVAFLSPTSKTDMYGVAKMKFFASLGGKSKIYAKCDGKEASAEIIVAARGGL